MIVKKVPARPSSRNAGVERARHAKHLIDYMQLPEKDNPYRDHLVAYMTSEKGPDLSTERLLHIGSRGFVNKTLNGQRLEMMATAQVAVRSPNPIDHWLLSWREGEFPTPEQVDRTVEMFVDHLGVADHQVIYALHGDTHNRHLHLALNRYDAETGRVVEINGGFNLEAAHQVVALVVEHFGWQAEADARYVVVDGELAYGESAKRRIIEGEQTIKPAAAAFEIRTGYKSVQRIAQEVALPIIREAGSWADLHDRLAERGIAYETRGSGAVIRIGDEAVKASAVHRKITMAALAKRLGLFVERDEHVGIVPRATEQDRLPGAFRAEEYRAQRAAWDEWCAQQKIAEVARQARSTRAPSPTLEALRQIAANRGKGDLAKPKKPARDLESFYYEENEEWSARQWRFRKAGINEEALWGKVRNHAPAVRSVDGYVAHQCLDGMRYARPGEGTAFIDRGDRIEVTSRSDEAALAALRLAVDKFDAVKVRGSEEFKQRIFALAIEHGYAHAIKNPEFAPPALKRGILAQAEAMRHGQATPDDGYAARGPSRMPVVETANLPAVEMPRNRPSISELAKTLNRPVARTVSKARSREPRHRERQTVVNPHVTAEASNMSPRHSNTSTRDTDDQHADLALIARVFHRPNWDPRDYHGQRDVPGRAEQHHRDAAGDDIALLSALRQRKGHDR
ncbi:MAG TPA: relaxase/mobilization nuclease domain-containing protein [Sphingomonas sp.]|nr:relaxase/mobilization nuclease domain-containing protein [Sphingomonas sp.]